MTPRGTDWSLALLVAVGAVSGLATWFAGAPSAAWVFAAHAAAGAALGAMVAVKLRRVRRRLPRGLLPLAVVAAALGSGLAWSSGARAYLAGTSLLVWHGVLGAVLAVAVLAHALPRARPLRRRDVADRRQFLAAAAIAAGGLVAWRVQRPVQQALGLPGARRRFTGSYDAGSFTGNAFPATSWVADDPRPAPRAGVRVDGLVARALALSPADLDRGEELVATLDCTGGFFTTQRWRGVRLGRLLDEAGAFPRARHVSVISRTGYRWSFGLEHARDLLVATRVGGEPLAHEHGAPCRLVVPGRRGLQWVKWVERIEVRADPDPGALASTIWSSFSAS
jgi:DMSO/TMAO reductase YedYZ molybdopterin-dependent catalytic subunit